MKKFYINKDELQVVSTNGANKVWLSTEPSKSCQEIELYSDILLYIVTGLCIREDGWHSRSSSICNILLSEAEARSFVIDDPSDLFEAGFYNHAVIESVPPNRLSKSKKIAWYKADYINRRPENWNLPSVHEIPEPANYARTQGLWM